MVKISIIGAGSMAWSGNLIKDLCLTKGLWGNTISLMDIDGRRLDVIYGLAKRYAAEVKADLRFEKTMYREEALEDSDFVFNTALAGEHSNYETQPPKSKRMHAWNNASENGNNKKGNARKNHMSI